MKCGHFSAECCRCSAYSHHRSYSKMPKCYSEGSSPAVTPYVATASCPRKMVQIIVPILSFRLAVGGRLCTGQILRFQKKKKKATYLRLTCLSAPFGRHLNISASSFAGSTANTATTLCSTDLTATLVSPLMLRHVL